MRVGGKAIRPCLPGIHRPADGFPGSRNLDGCRFLAADVIGKRQEQFERHPRATGLTMDSSNGDSNTFLIPCNGQCPGCNRLGFFRLTDPQEQQCKRGQRMGLIRISLENRPKHSFGLIRSLFNQQLSGIDLGSQVDGIKFD